MRTFVAVLLLGSLVAVPALAGQQDFTLVNKTGYTIDEVYVSPSKSDEWGDDVMGRDALGAGQSVEIVFNRRNTTCSYDLQVIYDDGETAEWSGFDLCTVNSITLFYNRAKGTTWAEYD